MVSAEATLQFEVFKGSLNPIRKTLFVAEKSCVGRKIFLKLNFLEIIVFERK
jgi:hypothetical protein